MGDYPEGKGMQEQMAGLQEQPRQSKAQPILTCRKQVRKTGTMERSVHSWMNRNEK